MESYFLLGEWRNAKTLGVVGPPHVALELPERVQKFAAVEDLYETKKLAGCNLS
jgi:hypothetical protein